MSKNFNINDLVWAKMKGYPLWPGKISLPTKGVKTKDKKHYVFFFGSENYAWIADVNIFPHSDELLKRYVSSNKIQPATFKVAIDQVESEGSKLKAVQQQNAVQITKGSPETKPFKSDPKKSMTSSTEKFLQLSSVETPSSTPSVEKLHGSLNEDVDQDKMVMESKRKSLRKRSLPATVGDTCDECSLSKVDKVDSELSSDASCNIAVVPPLECSAASIKATTKQIGFIGLGMMGQCIVKFLLSSGHNVTLYNRTLEKCKSFVEAGAAVANSPSEVVSTCDIIFCCVSDPAAVKDLVFGNKGILIGLQKSKGSSKGIVELSSIDPSTAEEVSEAVIGKGGQYLHAVLSGSLQLLEKRSMIVLGSGHQELFDQCKSCFLSFSRKTYFISHSVDVSSRLNLIFNMFQGTTTVALAEALLLTESCRLSVKDFLHILELSPLSCPFVMNKGNAMFLQNFTSDITLKYQQKDLKLALAMGNSVSQPMLVTAVAHEVYKRAKHSCSDKDISAVIYSLKK